MEDATALVEVPLAGTLELSAGVEEDALMVLQVLVSTAGVELTAGAEVELATDVEFAGEVELAAGADEDTTPVPQLLYSPADEELATGAQDEPPWPHPPCPAGVVTAAGTEDDTS